MSRRITLGIVVAATSVALIAAAPLVFGERFDAPQQTPTVTSGPTAGTVGAPPGAKPVALFPNLRSLPAATARIETAAGERRLRFAASFSNVGDGPLELLPDGATSCPAGQRHVVQAIYQDGDGDGVFQAGRDRRKSTTPAGCMLFHPAHKHWHFDATARYVLTRPGSAAPIAAQDKVSFCVRDSRPLPTQAGRPPGSKRTYGDCARDRRQGLSIGWYDHYRATLPGQSLTLPDGLPDGTYCLHTEADPNGLLQESREDDNGAASAVRIAGTAVSVARGANCTVPPRRSR